MIVGWSLLRPFFLSCLHPPLLSSRFVRERLDQCRWGIACGVCGSGDEPELNSPWLRLAPCRGLFVLLLCLYPDVALFPPWQFCHLTLTPIPNTTHNTPCSKDYIWCFDIPKKSRLLEALRERKKEGKWGRLVCTDISTGLEKVCVGEGGGCQL